MSKTKTESPPLTNEEIKDIKSSLKSKKWKTFDSANDLIDNLRKNVTEKI